MRVASESQVQFCPRINPANPQSIKLEGNYPFWQQNIAQSRKSFITQSKLMIF